MSKKTRAGWNLDFFPSKMPWQTNKPEKFNKDGKLTPEVGVIKKWGIIKNQDFPMRLHQH